MKTTDIQRMCNQDLAGELLSYKQLIRHLNWAIDSINVELNAKFPIFEDTMEEYTAFPDKYIRMCVIPGAVWHFYQVDEEGASAASQFASDFQRGIFYMLRDYAHAIPAEYVEDDNNGSLTAAKEDRTFGEMGLEVNMAGEVWR